MPSLVNRSIWSVTTSAFPSRIASKKSPSGVAHRRWSQGLYGGAKWVSTSNPSGSSLAVMLRSELAPEVRGT